MSTSKTHICLIKTALPIEPIFKFCYFFPAYDNFIIRRVDQFEFEPAVGVVDNIADCSHRNYVFPIDPEEKLGVQQSYQLFKGIVNVILLVFNGIQNSCLRHAVEKSSLFSRDGFNVFTCPDQEPTL